MANTLMQVTVNGRTIPVPVADAVRVSHEHVERMLTDMLTDIARDKPRLLRDLSDIDMIEQYYRAAGDVMIKAVVSRDFNGPDLYVELYVCQIERHTGIQL